MDNENKKLEEMLNSLLYVQSVLKKIMDITGTSDRVDDMRKEIKTLGWQHIMAKYHPDININDAGAMPLWEMYKLVCEQMKRDGVI